MELEGERLSSTPRPAKWGAQVDSWQHDVHAESDPRFRCHLRGSISRQHGTLATQPAFNHVAESGGSAGRVLDAGCGTGEHALMAASLGHEAVGVDMSVRAIEMARTKAAERGVEARFLVADALRLVELGEQFETVLDCGFFHVLDDDARELRRQPD